MELVEAYKREVVRLNEFRRHPDWSRALDVAVGRHLNLVTLKDGRKAFRDENKRQIIEAADREFVEALIRQGY